MTRSRMRMISRGNLATRLSSRRWPAAADEGSPSSSGVRTCVRRTPPFGRTRNSYSRIAASTSRNVSKNFGTRRCRYLCDNYGNGIHLGERDCSVQRRRQKLIEEAPSIHLSADQRQHMCETAVKGALAAGYSSAGTVEFILDPDGNYYFMEINARIQVEHPVSEMISSVDLIKEQIRLAAGEPLRFTQDDIQLRGHAIECRINAEDPDNDFQPDRSGHIRSFIPPGGPGTRVDTYVYSGWSVPPFYDSLVAKLIVWDEDRPSAIDRAVRALSETTIEGIATTIPFHLRVMTHPAFREGDVFTDFIVRHLKMQQTG